MSRQAAVRPGERRRSEPFESVAGLGSAAQILDRRTTLDLEGLDRVDLNAYVPALQTEAGIAAFLTKHRGHRMASSVLLDPISRAFEAQIDRLINVDGVPKVEFEREDLGPFFLKFCSYFPYTAKLCLAMSI